MPESAPLGSLPGWVVNSVGGGDTAALTVTARPAAANHVNWRFRMNGPYSAARPAIAADGTVYSVDVFAHLYALTPDGGLKWLVRGAGAKGVALSADGSIYVASESFINAYNPDGSAKWSFVQNPRALTCLGVSVGPDGNIYSVGTEGMGVFSFTPAGTLRWNYPELYQRPIVDYGEIVFGPNGSNQNLYFSANTHLRAVRLDGNSVFTVTRGQPAVARTAACTTRSRPFRPMATSFGPSRPVPGQCFYGAGYWKRRHPLLRAESSSLRLTQMARNAGTPPSTATSGPGRWWTHRIPNSSWAARTRSIIPVSFSAPVRWTGSERWRLTLPAEDGFNQFPDTRARFTTDGGTPMLSRPRRPATTTRAGPSFIPWTQRTTLPPPRRASSRARRTEQRGTLTLICHLLVARGSNAAAVERTAITRSCLRF